MISGGGINGESSGSLAGWAGAIVYFFTLLFSIHSYAASELALDQERQFQFAEQYFQRGEYYRAIGEYERFIYFFPHAHKAELAKYRIGLSYLKGEQYEQAIQRFYALIEEYQDTNYALRSFLEISEAYVRLNRYAMALTALHNLITIVPDQALRDEAQYQRAWVYLEMGLWNKAIESFEKVSPQNREKFRVNETLVELKRDEPIRTKNPTLAGLLAVVPGAGHLYCGRNRDALISFLLNGAMIYAAYEAFDNDLDAIGAIISLFELGFYAGNIYSAVSSAHKYNRDAKDRFLDELRGKTRMDISLGSPAERSLLLLSRFSF
jgi:TolA-binding protein/TM2 domain-containing membrane protein YozV